MTDLWRNRFGGVDVADAKRLKVLEIGNTRLKKLLAESMREAEVTRELLRKKATCTAHRRHERKHIAQFACSGSQCGAT